MQQAFREMTVTDVEYATKRVRDWLASAEEAVFDLKRVERNKQAKCVRCFYRKEARIGGAAMTEAACGICAKTKMFSNTATDKVCLECAVDNDLCIECGCDRSLRRRRKVKLA